MVLQKSLGFVGLSCIVLLQYCLEDHGVVK